MRPLWIAPVLGLLLSELCRAQVFNQCCQECRTALINDLRRGTNAWPTDYDMMLISALCDGPFFCAAYPPSCPLGQEPILCSSVTFTTVEMSTSPRCQQCPSGKYRDTIALQPTCVDCTACSSTQIVLQMCTPLRNRICGCPAGTYAQGTSCLACSVCRTPGFRLKSACGASTNTECEACPEGYRTTGDNQGACTACADGFYLTDRCTSCLASSASCGENFWIQCVGGTRVCIRCAGHAGGSLCPAGTGVNGQCGGSQLSDPGCQDCGPGLERPENTPTVGGLQVCVKCGTGKFKAASGRGDCQNCTNAPVNSAYLAWGVAETASSSACPWCVFFSC